MFNREMIVDLTPLLDVVLILLFMILTTQTQANQDTIQSLEHEVSQLEQSQLPTTQSEEAWLRTFQESIGKINIIFPTDPTENNIFAVGEDDYLSVKSDTEDLATWLLEEVSRYAEDVIIVTFSYNNDAIYYQDYLNMVNAITNLDALSEQTIVYREEMVEGELLNQQRSTADE